MAYRLNDVVTKRQSRFYVLSIIISAILSLIALLSYFSGVSSTLSSIVNIAVYPINKCASVVSEKIISVGSYFGNIKELKEENLKLQAENNKLKKVQAVTDAVRTENEQLYSYLELKREFNKLSLINASIVTKGSGNFLTAFTIDKGTLHGVKKDMPIITSNGILGVVTEEGISTSRGITLVSHNSSVGVYLSRTGTPGVLRGDYKLSLEGKCKISGLPADTQVEIGDPVVTSGTGEIFPSDLSVGTVTEIITDSNTQTLTLVVTPACDLINEESVMVISDFERTYEAPDNSESEQ